MKLSLKKARKLESQIKNYVDSMDLYPKVALRVKESRDESKKNITLGQKAFKRTLNDYRDLNSLRYAIRNTISKYNHTKEINSQLAEKVKLENELSLLKQILSYDELENEAIIEDKKEVLSESNSNYRKTSFEASVLSSELKKELAERVYQLKNLIDGLEDSLAQKNLSAKITLSEEHKNLLKSHRIL